MFTSWQTQRFLIVVPKIINRGTRMFLFSKSAGRSFNHRMPAIRRVESSANNVRSREARRLEERFVRPKQSCDRRERAQCGRTPGRLAAL